MIKKIILTGFLLLSTIPIFADWPTPIWQQSPSTLYSQDGFIVWENGKPRPNADLWKVDLENIPADSTQSGFWVEWKPGIDGTYRTIYYHLLMGENTIKKLSNGILRITIYTGGLGNLKEPHKIEIKPVISERKTKIIVLK